MAHRVALQTTADLDSVWYHVANESGNLEVANQLIDAITSRFLLLGSYPYLGRVRDDDFGVDSRSFAVGEYIIV